MKTPAIFAIGAVLSLGVADGRAAERAGVAVEQRDGYDRIVISTENEIGYEATIIEDALVITFDRPLQGDFAAPVAEAPETFLGAMHADETTALKFRIPDGVRLHWSQSVNVAAFDIVRDSFIGDPDKIISRRERAARFFAVRTPVLKPDKLREPQIVHLGMIQPMFDPLEDVNEVRAFEAWRARVHDDGFLAVEQELLTRAADNQAAAADLAYFYFAQGLFPESVAVIDDLDPAHIRTHLIVLEGAAAVKMGRWRQAIDILSQQSVADSPDAAAWRALAHYRLGAFAEATSFFDKAQGAVPFEEEGAAYFLAQAQVALSKGDVAEARAATEKLRARPLTHRQRVERRLVEGRIAFVAGDEQTALRLIEDVARNGTRPVSLRAKLDLARHAFDSGQLTAEDALAEVESLALRWRGGAVERESLILIARLSEQAGDIKNAVEAWRRIVLFHRDADMSEGAASSIRQSLASVFDNRSLNPSEAAEVFYSNIDFAPPGADGDALIREAASTLLRLDLLLEASELLRHQVFHRLRGAERSAVAADLAAIYLGLGEPDRALEVMSKSRLKRLPKEIEAKRRLTTARALHMAGNDEEALQHLSGADDFASLALLGDIRMAQKEYGSAGAAFAAAARIAESPLAREASAVLIRAAAAFAIVGNEAALDVLLKEIGPKLEEGHAQRLFEAIASDDFETHTDEFLVHYQAYLSE